MDTPPSPRTCGVCDEPLRGDERGRHRQCKREVRASRPRTDGRTDASSLTSVLLPALLTVNQVADALRLSKSKVYEMVASGDLKAYRPGGRLRIAADAVARLLDRSRV